jgi:hypothetical protein
MVCSANLEKQAKSRLDSHALAEQIQQRSGLSKGQELDRVNKIGHEKHAAVPLSGRRQ